MTVLSSYITVLCLSLFALGGCSSERLMTFEMTFQLISDCSQAGSGAVQCEDTEEVVKAKETGTWFIEPREGKTFVLTNHLGEVIKGVGPFDQEEGVIYQARKYEEQVDTGDGCHTYTDELYNIVLKDNELTGDLTIAQTGGSAQANETDEDGEPIGTVAACGVLWAHEIKYELKGSESDELVPARR